MCGFAQRGLPSLIAFAFLSWIRICLASEGELQYQNSDRDELDECLIRALQYGLGKDCRKSFDLSSVDTNRAAVQMVDCFNQRVGKWAYIWKGFPLKYITPYFQKDALSDGTEQASYTAILKSRMSTLCEIYHRQDILHRLRSLTGDSQRARLQRIHDLLQISKTEEDAQGKYSINRGSSALLVSRHLEPSSSSVERSLAQARRLRASLKSDRDRMQVLIEESSNTTVDLLHAQNRLRFARRRQSEESDTPSPSRIYFIVVIVEAARTLDGDRERVDRPCIYLKKASIRLLLSVLYHNAAQVLRLSRSPSRVVKGSWNSGATETVYLAVTSLVEVADLFGAFYLRHCRKTNRSRREPMHDTSPCA